MDAALNRGGIGSDTPAIDTKNPTVTVDIVGGALSGETSTAATAATPAWLSPLRSPRRRAPASPNPTSSLGRPHARCRFADHDRRHPLHGDGHRG